MRVIYCSCHFIFKPNIHLNNGVESETSYLNNYKEQHTLIMNYFTKT